jgi:hypothetical protein
MDKFIIKTFDQLKNDNFDQVNFGQTIPCLRFGSDREERQGYRGIEIHRKKET